MSNENNHKWTNKLIQEKSPYLLQHAHNPVDWYPWGGEAFARAVDGSVNFALKLWTIITTFAEIFGGILILISFLGLKKQTSDLMEMDDDEFIPEEVTSNLLHYLNLRLIEIIIVAISGLIRIFMR